MAESRWRVVLLEDDLDTRLYFEHCIAAHAQLALAASFDRLTRALDWFEQDANSADVLLTDLALPDGHGLALIRHLAVHQPACEVLVVSVFGDEESVLACVEAGAVGYIHKDSQPADVAQVIVDVKHGASPISPMIARKLLERLRRRLPAEALPQEPSQPPVDAAATALPSSSSVLSFRQSAVLELIARGYTYAEIARLEGLSVHTVQSHIKNLYAKLAVHSRSEAVFEASRMGLLASMRAGA
jgi:DNA-binding NarL/FixJ family response regulator